MKCEIIRDLLPSYVDGLTSEESNREITAHVAECAPCKEILEQMQEEVQEKAPKEKRKINPFRKFNRRMMSAVAVAVAVCIGVGGFGYKAFARGFAINPQEITMEPKLEGDMLYLNFSVEKGGLTNVGSFYDSEVAKHFAAKCLATARRGAGIEGVLLGNEFEYAENRQWREDECGAEERRLSGG